MDSQVHVEQKMGRTLACWAILSAPHYRAYDWSSFQSLLLTQSEILPRGFSLKSFKLIGNRLTGTGMAGVANDIVLQRDLEHQKQYY